MPKLDRVTPAVDEKGVPLQNLHLLSEDVDNLKPIIGTGSPENVVEARQGRFYIDTSGASGSVQYVKKLADIAGNKKQGWSL